MDRNYDVHNDNVDLCVYCDQCKYCATCFYYSECRVYHEELSRTGECAVWYDQSSRLVHATIPAPGHTQDFVYDGFGNMTSMTTGSESHALATTTATNRLSANVYDVVGNVTTDELAYQYVYDAFNMITDKRGGTEIDV